MTRGSSKLDRDKEFMLYWSLAERGFTTETVRQKQFYTAFQ